MAALRRCPRCANTLPPDVAQGLCPACLLRAGLEPASEQPSGGSAGEDVTRDVGVAFSPDGRYQAAAYQQGRDLTVRNVDRRAIAVDDPGAARFSPDSRRIAVSHQDGELLVYDTLSEKSSPNAATTEPGSWRMVPSLGAIGTARWRWAGGPWTWRPAKPPP